MLYKNDRCKKGGDESVGPVNKVSNYFNKDQI